MLLIMAVMAVFIYGSSTGSAVSQELEQAPDKLLSPAEASRLKPVLSDRGRERVSQNLSILADNIEVTQRNHEAAEANVKVVRLELAELEKLEAEHKQLAKQYDDYLERSDKELQKNDQATQQLESRIQQITTGAFSKKASPESTNELQKFQTEKKDRARWRADTMQKMQEVHELKIKLANNVRDIQSRRGPLWEDEKSWMKRAKDYESLLAELKQKKAELGTSSRK